jgi:hypothetical protein
MVSPCELFLVPFRINVRHAELASDPTIRSHLNALYDTLLEQNLLRIVEPYLVVEISYVAEMVVPGTPGSRSQTFADDPG